VVLVAVVRVQHGEPRDENHRLVQAAFDPAGDGGYRTAYRLLRPDGQVARRWFSSRSSGCSMASHCR
jgi:hypothetical protein